MIFKYDANFKQNEIQFAKIHNVSTAPTSPVPGQIIFNTTLTKLGYWNGTSWIYDSTLSFLGSLPIVIGQSGDTYTISINPATTSAAGSMSAADKTKLDAATTANTPSTIVLRDASGNFIANQITAATITGLNAPVNGSDAVNKSYVDSLSQGLNTKQSVVVATTANITLSGTQTIDGVSVAAGQRVLVKNQTTQSQNGIYLSNAGAWTRTSDLATGASAAATYVFVQQGATQGDTGWLCISDSGVDIVGTSTLLWTQFSAATALVPGAGLQNSSNTWNIVPVDSSIIVNPDTIGVRVNPATLEIDTTLGIQIKAASILSSH